MVAVAPAAGGGVADWPNAAGLTNDAVRASTGWALGQGQLGRDGLGTYGPALPVHRDPVSWLKAHRIGIVIVNVDMAARVLAGCTLRAADDRHGRLLRRRLRLPAPSILTLGAEHPAPPESEPAA
jgi:hypothetical protein